MPFNSATSVDLTNLTPQTLGDDIYHFAGQFDGADHDARLATLLGGITEPAQIVMLEPESYQDNVSFETTVGESITVRGVRAASVGGSAGTEIEAAWDVWFGRLEDVGIGTNAEITATARATMSNLTFTAATGDIIIDADDVLIWGVTGAAGTITFNAGTTGGVAGLIADNVTVTDNGTNTVL